MAAPRSSWNGTISFGAASFTGTTGLAGNRTVVAGPQGGINQRFYRLNQNAVSSAYQTLTINFSYPVYNVSFTITDIDMAGDFEPWRGPQFDDIRIIKDIYPPRIDLAFRLVDAEGNVAKEGKRELRDTAFLMRITMGTQTDTLRHEKQLLDDWMRDEFPSPRKSS